MKTYSIIIKAVVVTDEPPTENTVEMMVGLDYPTITSTRIVEMVPKEPDPEPDPEPECELKPVLDWSRSNPLSKPEPVSCQTTLALKPATSRSTKKIGKTRPSRVRDADRDGAISIEFFFSSQGYTSAARRLCVGTFEGPAPAVGVWLTMGERELVKVEHLEHLSALKELKKPREWNRRSS